MVFDVGASELAAGPNFSNPCIIIYVLDASYICTKPCPASNEFERVKLGVVPEWDDHWFIFLEGRRHQYIYLGLTPSAVL